MYSSAVLTVFVTVVHTSSMSIGPHVSVLPHYNGHLKYWWDDLCCTGADADKLHLHPVPLIMPGCWRCPFKDGFHAVQLVTGTCNGGTDNMPHFSRDIGQRLRPTFKEDEDIVIKYIIAEKEREGQDIGPIEARRIALARSATAVTARSARFLESPHNRPGIGASLGILGWGQRLRASQRSTLVCPDWLALPL